MNMVIVNFKTYDEGTGEKAIELLRICDKVAKETGATIVAVPSVLDMASCCSVKGNEGLDDVVIYSQHVDPDFKEGKPGNNTGRVLARKLKEMGAEGSLINHSEDKMTQVVGGDVDVSKIKARVETLRENGLKSIVCCGMKTNDETINEGNAIAGLNPDYIAVEPPDLIGGDVSVTTKPELITNLVDALDDAGYAGLALTGAGVKTGEHAKKAVELGTKGVLVASGIVKPKEATQEEALLDMAKGVA